MTVLRSASGATPDKPATAELRGRHQATCGVCGAFLARPKPGNKVVICGRCGTEWEVPR